MREACIEISGGFLFLFFREDLYGIMMMLGSLYHQIKKHERKNREPQYWRELCEKQEELIHELYQLDREASQMRHDMKGKLDILYRLLMKEKYREAEGYLEKLGAELRSCPELPQDTGNEGLNAALMRAVRECRKKGYISGIWYWEGLRR